MQSLERKISRERIVICLFFLACFPNYSGSFWFGRHVAACWAGLEKSIQEELHNWKKPETDYHTGINDPGEGLECHDCPVTFVDIGFGNSIKGSLQKQDAVF